MDYATFEKIFLEYFPFYKDLSKEDQKLLCQNTQFISYKKGETVHTGADCLGSTLVYSGDLRVYMLSEEGKDITLYRLLEGDFCMLTASCVIQAITFDVCVDAEADSKCIVMNSSLLEILMDKYPSMKIYMLETAIEKFSNVMWSMQQILFMSLDKRLAILLIDELAKSEDDTIHLTHEQLAKYMGSAREVVSRMLKFFSEEGLVELSRGGVKILDKKRLRELTI
ncbi:MAG: Crp/Fnr family transcriptional regulator [Ruminococcaceae bacterium]|jgi:CRP/FNR family transcriptional regulator|nr:Crp/Fnr family transcriptional regulator [Oscillospiraceae bacterium]